MDGFKVQSRLLFHSQEKEPVLLILQEQVLCMRAGDFAAQATRLLNREEGRMLKCLHLDAEFVEIAHQVLSGCRHAGSPIREAVCLGALPDYVQAEAQCR